MLDTIVSFILGLVGGVVLQAYFRPLSALVERHARRQWADPLIVAVERDPAIIWSGEMDWISFSVYIDDPTRVPKMSTDRTEWMRAARSINAVDAFLTPLKITIQARTEAAVVIERVRVVRHRKVRLDHGIILTRPTGGAELEPRRFEIELERLGPVPVITWKDISNHQQAEPPGIKLAAGDVERFHIWAMTGYDSEEATWHEWSLVLDVLVEGVKFEYPIDDDGKPFVTVSKGHLPHRIGINGEDRWTDFNPNEGNTAEE